MQLIDITKVKISPERQRRFFSDESMQELVDSVAQKGLFHAICLRQEGEDLILAAGERRFRAIQDMWMLGKPLKYNNEPVPEGFIPYTLVGELDELEAWEVELDENLKRSDLTWQERAAAMSKLHNLRTQQAKKLGRIHTVGDTALEIKGSSSGRQYTDVRNNLIVAKHLDNPEIQRAKSAEDAMKLLRRQEEQERFKELAKTATVQQAAKPDYINLIHDDCRNWLQTCPDETFDAIITDPPYGIDAQTHRSGASTNAFGSSVSHNYDDTYEHWQTLMRAWCPESFRVTKPQAHAYVFCDIDNFHELKGLMQLAGWYVFRTPLIRTRPGASGRVPLPLEGPRRQWEAILYAIKGHKHVISVQGDVIEAGMDDLYPHGAVKPINLYRQLLERSVRPGDKVLDTFAGSGPAIPACFQLRVELTAIEQEDAAFGMCKDRLHKVRTESPLSAVSDELSLALGLGLGK